MVYLYMWCGRAGLIKNGAKLFTLFFFIYAQLLFEKLTRSLRDRHDRNSFLIQGWNVVNSE